MNAKPSLQNKLQELINNGPMSPYQYLIVGLCFVLNMNDGMDVLVVSYTGTEIISEWGLSKGQMGWVFSAGLIGMTLGSLLLAPFGDKIGRRKIFLISLFLNTIGMLSIYLITQYYQLILLRLITGLGIGGILPTMATVTSEFSNARQRDFNVSLIQGGWPVGAILTGFFVAWAVPEFGWRFAYVFAGSVSLLMLIAVFFLMPESLDFLGKQRKKDTLQKVNVLLQKLNRDPLKTLQTFVEVSSRPSHRANLRQLLSSTYKTSTLFLWTGIFFGFLTLYTLMSWVPTIASEAGMPFELATYAGVALNLGALSGVIAMGILGARFGLKKINLLFMLVAFCVMLGYANLNLSYLIMFISIFLIGFFVQGGFNSFFPMATRIYPSDVRTSGVGLAMGIGRFGAILGPLLFGLLSDLEISTEVLFNLFSLPLIIAGIMAYKNPSKNL